MCKCYMNFQISVFVFILTHWNFNLLNNHKFLKIKKIRDVEIFEISYEICVKKCWLETLRNIR